MASVARFAARGFLHPSTSFPSGSLLVDKDLNVNCAAVQLPCNFSRKLRPQSCSFPHPARNLPAYHNDRQWKTSRSQRGGSHRVLCSVLKEKEGTNGKAEPSVPKEAQNPPQPQQQPTSKQSERNLEAQVKDDTGPPSEAVFRQLRQEKQRADKLAAKTEELAQELQEVKQKASEEKQSYENLTWRQKRVIAGKRDSVGGTLAELVEDLGQAALSASSVLLGRKEKGPPVENLDIAKVSNLNDLSRLC